jgi:hypothetical protein
LLSDRLRMSQNMFERSRWMWGFIN